MAQGRQFNSNEQEQICALYKIASDWPSKLWIRIAESLFNNSSEGICLTDTNEKIIEVNPTFCRLTGFSRLELLGNTPRLFHSGLQDKTYYQAMWKALHEKGQWSGELWNRKPDGGLYAVRLNISVVCNDAGEVANYVGLMADVTHARLHVQDLEKTVDHDALTGLPNRTLLADRFAQAVAHSLRTDLLLAACYLDLDGFKAINDSYGHAIGDDVLKEVAARLKAAVRIGDTVARIGGDEFVLLLWGLHDIEECKKTVNRIVGEIARPILPPTYVTDLSASIGIAIYPFDGDDQCELLARADRAMYQSKQAGGNRFTFWS